MREARVRVRAGVDDDAVHAAAQRVDGVDQLALAVVLRELARSTPSSARHRRAASCSTSASVSRPYSAGSRVAEQIEVRSVEDGDSHVFFSPLSQALNCAMSSVASGDPGAASADDCSAGSAISSAKNWSNENPLAAAALRRRRRAP